MQAPRYDVDLFGEPVPEPRPTEPAPGYAHDLAIPADMPAHTREWVLKLPEGPKRDAAIRRYLDHQAEAARRRRAREAKAKLGNPLVLECGAGPEGATCRSCCWLLRLRYHDRTYTKCALRGMPTHGTGTDHKATWPACARYAAGEPQSPTTDQELRAVVDLARAVRRTS